MMTARDKILFQQMNKDLNIVKEKYPDKTIFGVFLFNDLKETEIIIVPSFEAFCLAEPLISEQIKIKDHIVKILDIRYVYKATEQGYPEVIESLYTDYYIINPQYTHIFQNLFRCHRDEIKEGIGKKEPSERLKIAIVKFLRCVFNDKSNTVKFIKQLSDVEKAAIKYIVDTVGDGGLFSQAKAASSAGISRAAMTNLIGKMNISGVANITYMGNKGTYIEIVDDTLLDPFGLKD